MILLSLSACKRHYNEKSGTKFVVDQKLGNETESEVRLSKASDAKIPYKALSFTGEFSSNEKLPSFNRNFLKFRFGQLTNPQFDFLMSKYSMGRSRVVYSEKRDDYELADFLPIPIQAVDTKRLATFKDISTTISKSQEKLAILANCWMRAYELHSKNDVFMRTWKANVVGEQVFKVLMDPQYSKPVPLTDVEKREEEKYGDAFARFATPGVLKIVGQGKNDNFLEISALLKSLSDTGKLPPFPSYGKLSNLQMGDLLLVGSADNPLHAAIYVDKDVFFERTQVGEVLGGGFRLVTWNDILQAYLAFPGQFSHWRIHKALPDPERFILPGTGDKTPVRYHKFSFDKNGRAYFDFEKVP
jgi:hypothetical protein